jgi:hypothetical protein
MTNMSLGGRALLRRGAVVVPVSAVVTSVAIAVALAVRSLGGKTPSVVEVLGASYFLVATLAPYVFVAMLVLGAAAAGLATAVTLAPAVGRPARIQRYVWISVFAGFITIALLCFSGVTLVTSPSILGPIAVGALTVFASAWTVFAIADRRAAAST